MRPEVISPGADAAVGVAAHLGDEDAAVLVEGHRDRIDDLRLAGDEFDAEAFGELEGGSLLLGRQRLAVLSGSSCRRGGGGQSSERAGRGGEREAWTRERSVGAVWMAG